MSKHSSNAHPLRLVNTDASSARHTSPQGNTARVRKRRATSPGVGQPDALGIGSADPLRALADARSPRTSPTSDLQATDARWVFAVRVSKALEPGPEPALPPDRRRRLMSIAKALGLRPFDANLIIAIVQDAARSGEPLSSSVEERLGLVRAVHRAGVSRTNLLLVAFVSAVASAALVAWSATWIMGG